MIISFVFSVLILGFIPGPNVAVIAATSVRYGLRAGFLTVFGTSLGLAGQLFFVCLGLGVVLDLLVEILWIIRWCGVAYLSFLALQAFRQAAFKGSKERFDHGNIEQTAFFSGIAIAFLNPKTLLFLIAFLPQFIVLDHSMSVQQQLIVLSCLYLFVLAGVDCGWVMLASLIKDRLGQGGTVRQVFYGVFLFIAAAFLFFSRKEQ